MGALSRIWGRMQRPIRESKAPHFRALARSMSRGTQLLSLSSLVRGLYLDTARGRWLSEWAWTLGMTRQGESDTDFRARILSTALTRGDTRLEPVEQAISAAAGVRVTVHPTLPYVARYDNLEEMVTRGTYMADFERIVAVDHSGDNVGRWGVNPWGDTPWGILPPKPTYVYDDTPFNHLGYLGRTPLRPGWGSSGALIVMGEEYDEAAEARTLEAAGENLSAASGYDLFWSYTFRNELRDTVKVLDSDMQANDSGYGTDEWGGSTWG